MFNDASVRAILHFRLSFCETVKGQRDNCTADRRIMTLKITQKTLCSKCDLVTRRLIERSFLLRTLRTQTSQYCIQRNVRT